MNRNELVLVEKSLRLAMRRLEDVLADVYTALGNPLNEDKYREDLGQSINRAQQQCARIQECLDTIGIELKTKMKD